MLVNERVIEASLDEVKWSMKRGQMFVEVGGIVERFEPPTLSIEAALLIDIRISGHGDDDNYNDEVKRSKL